MIKRKTVYSVWYRSVVRQQKIKKLEKAKQKAIEDEKKRLELLKSNEEKRNKREILEQERRELRKKRSEAIRGGMVKDDSIEEDLLHRNTPLVQLDDIISEDETVIDEKKRQKEEEQIRRTRERFIRNEEKEREKAIIKRTEEEGAAKKYEDSIAEFNEKVRIENDRKRILLHREEQESVHKVLRKLEESKSKELTIQLKKEAAAKKEADKKLQIEYEKQERLRREKEKADREIEARRRKAAGITWKTVLKEWVRHVITIYSFQNLKSTINTYGYSYSIGEFLKQSGMVVIAVTGIAWYSKLRGAFLIAIIAASVIAMPILLYSWFGQTANTKKFEMVQSYLSNILPIFMQKPKIRHALGEIKELSNGQMNSCVQHAIDYIDTAVDDDNIMATGLSFIETEFPNSRIKAVHKLLLDIENGNSKDYTNICENMYTDIESWIRRVYGFQKDLKSRRNSLIILCLFSLVLNSVFTAMYGSSEIFDGFTDRPLYQWSTMLFIGATLVAIALIITKLHGSWLIYDSDEKEELDNIRAYSYIHMHTPEPKKSDKIMAVFMILFGLVVIFLFEKKAGAATFMLAWMFWTKEKSAWNMRHKHIAKSLMLEFPVWLRGVALNLHNMTVINAIKESTNSCSYCMKKEIEKFFEIYDENPTSIRAFNEFLAEYKIEDVQASMKVLFTIQSMPADEIQNQVSMIINRNQELLTKTETIQNNDSLGMAELLGYAPMVLLTIQLLISMLLMFLHIMEYMSNIMSTGI